MYECSFGSASGLKKMAYYEILKISTPLNPYQERLFISWISDGDVTFFPLRGTELVTKISGSHENGYSLFLRWYGPVVGKAYVMK